MNLPSQGVTVTQLTRRRVIAACPSRRPERADHRLCDPRRRRVDAKDSCEGCSRVVDVDRVGDLEVWLDGRADNYPGDFQLLHGIATVFLAQATVVGRHERY